MVESCRAPTGIVSAPPSSAYDVKAWFLPRGDLFLNVNNLFASAQTGRISGDRVGADQFEPLSPIAAFVLGGHSVITVEWSSVRPSLMQCFLRGGEALICSEIGTATGRPLYPNVIDLAIELTVWAADRPTHLERWGQLWRELNRLGAVDQLELLSTPKLYGSKHRIIEFLSAVATVSLPPGAPVLDLMSGTGIVARKLASRHQVSANDANPYAALLTRAQGLTFDDGLVDRIVSEVRTEAEVNLAPLRNLTRDLLEEEAEFLHSEINESTPITYAEFCKKPILPDRTGFPQLGLPHDLCTTRYANAYFGVAQATEIDSIRAGIDAVYNRGERQRDLALAAMIVAACLCGSGPHFAQPPKIRTVHAARVLIERRARSYMWEFELALRRLAARQPLVLPIGPVTTLDWRDALDAFMAATGSSRPVGVYVDPPYSKLQYSRYYHVLNVLIGYDYPECSGVGRYPPRSDRFSSRFEYRARSAEREFLELFKRCSGAGLTMLLSYSDHGFVSIPKLIEQMRTCFANVSVFAEPIRHHSQGVKLGGNRGNTFEYVLVGQP